MSNREIKFRAYDKKKKIMLGMEQLLLDCNYDTSYLDNILAGGQAETEGLHGYEFEPYEGASNYVLMQYIGRKDTNGVEIFDDDVIAYDHKVMDGSSNVPVTVTEKIVVKYDNTDRCGYQPFCDNFDYDGMSFLDTYTESRIIGNIHDNPELESE